jgi:hypothetical protein
MVVFFMRVIRSFPSATLFSEAVLYRGFAAEGKLFSPRTANRFRKGRPMPVP